MARAPNEKLNKALSLYQKGYKLIDIAKELDIPAGTVRRWKNTYNWDSERSERKSERSEKKKVSNRKKNKESIAEEVKEVLENTDEEAFKAYEDGKEIENIERKVKFKKKITGLCFYKFGHSEKWLVINDDTNIFSIDMIRGKWYIND